MCALVAHGQVQDTSAKDAEIASLKARIAELEQKLAEITNAQPTDAITTPIPEPTLLPTENIQDKAIESSVQSSVEETKPNTKAKYKRGEQLDMFADLFG